MILHRNHPYGSPQFACASLGDLANFGALTPFAILLWFGVKFYNFFYYRSWIFQFTIRLRHSHWLGVWLRFCVYVRCKELSYSQPISAESSNAQTYLCWKMYLDCPFRWIQYRCRLQNKSSNVFSNISHTKYPCKIFLFSRTECYDRSFLIMSKSNFS